MKRTSLLLGALLILGLLPQAASARDAQTAMNAAMQHLEGFVARKGMADGYVVIFHVMRAPQGVSLSRDEYHLMVSIEKDGQALHSLPVRSTVRHPNGEIDEQDGMPQLGDWYMARYNLNHDQGRHHLFVDFKVSGKHYSSDIYYPDIDFSER